MLINKSNYEVFALDYIEGNLSGADLKAMRQFLQAHPEIDTEVELLRTDFVELIPDDSIVYAGTEWLLREEAAAIVPFYRRAMYQWAAAASILLLLGFGVGYLTAHRTLQTGGAVATIVTPELPAATEQMTAEAEPTATHPVAVVEEATSIEKVISQPKEKVAMIEPTRTPERKATTSTIVTTSEVVALSEVVAQTEPIVEEENAVVQAEPTTPVETQELTKTVATTTTLLPQLPEAPLTTIPTLQEDTVVVILMTERLATEDNILNKVNKFRRLMGRLPFDDVTLRSFVPTYFAD
jgi:regulator of extracellular matrix RemA (YlzA/DUF370 family)